MSSLIHVPLPDIGRELKGHEQQVLMNIRADMEPVLRRMFPRTSDSGKSEIELVSKKFNGICDGVGKECDPIFKKGLNDRDIVALYQLRQKVYDSFFQRAKEMTRDELLLLIVAQTATPFLADRYPGLPTTLVR